MAVKRSTKWTYFFSIRCYQNRWVLVGILVKWGAPQHSLRSPVILELSVLWEICQICPSFCEWLCVVMLCFKHSRNYSKMLARFCNQMSWILKSVVSLLHGVKFICFHSTYTSSWIVSYLAGCWIQSPDSHSDWILFSLKGLSEGKVESSPHTFS